ncbi:MAG: decarboxylating NADP(+)-dependent phosphogluconate dehydrogenase [Sedimentisphaerales bacterium]|nr:decarboxylating NADP(+)-dependent phosphogluconate dehydrogenase [Sedimentisphaerales bacterium]
MAQADIGLIGLAVMGENLILNMESKGFTVACFNRTVSKVDDFVNGRAKGKSIIGCHSLEEFVGVLQKPRKIMLMVKAGSAVDEFIGHLLPLLENGDIIIDGGNSNYQDTIRRTQLVESQDKLYIGTGVSGGEEGALLGPAIMPGGSPTAWEHVKPVFQKIAARAPDGSPCCEWMGENGAGHFVKMVHNGIEYGDMQMICETYQIMKEGLGMSNDEMHKVFAQWDQEELDSYLIEITADILQVKDQDGRHVIDLILDTAGQKGTGKWTVIEALDIGQPLTLIAEAVFARCLSALKEERVEASKALTGPKASFRGKKDNMLHDLRQALYASKIVSYTQGFMLMRAAAKDHKWNLKYGDIASIWRGGCIIRSVFLGKIKEAYDRNAGLDNLLLDPFFKSAVVKAQGAWRRVVATAVKLGIPVPAIGSALSFYDGYRHERLSANLLQAQRDYFGAHTYERVDKPRGQFFHTNWTGRGGTTSASTYTI